MMNWRISYGLRHHATELHGRSPRGSSPRMFMVSSTTAAPNIASKVMSRSSCVTGGPINLSRKRNWSHPAAVKKSAPKAAYAKAIGNAPPTPNSASLSLERSVRPRSVRSEHHAAPTKAPISTPRMTSATALGSGDRSRMINASKTNSGTNSVHLMTAPQSVVRIHRLFDRRYASALARIKLIAEGCFTILNRKHSSANDLNENCASARTNRHPLPFNDGLQFSCQPQPGACDHTAM
jgi:hypothetical protein